MAPRRAFYDVLRNASLKGLSLGLERGGRLLVAVAAATTLGRTSFGRFVFASTLTAMLAVGTDLGLGVWTTRALARGQGEEDVVRLGLALRTLASLPYALAVATATLIVSGDETRPAVAWLGIAALLNAFADHFGAVLRGYRRFPDEARLNSARAVLATGTGLMALYVGRTLGALSVGTAAASFLGFIYGIVIVLRIRAPLGQRGGRMLDRTKALRALRQSLPIWLAGLLSILYFKVDTLFLHAFNGDDELGAYGAAYKLFEGALLLPAVLLSVTFPELARVHDDAPARRTLERQLAALLTAAGVTVGAISYFLRAPLIEMVFGAGFRRAEGSLAVLALGLPLLYVNFGLTHFLLARDMERTTTLFALMMLVLNVALDVTLIPRAGGPGAAWATTLSEVALTIVCLIALRGSRPGRTPP
jgi:O-antigen/teichoic acid export membrane protein